MNSTVCALSRSRPVTPRQVPIYPLHESEAPSFVVEDVGSPSRVIRADLTNCTARVALTRTTYSTSMAAECATPWGHPKEFGALISSEWLSDRSQQADQLTSAFSRVDRESAWSTARMR